MGLLQSLQNALNKLYDGNITAHNALQDEGVSHKDMYKCDCGLIVPFEEWNEEHKMCIDCYMGMCENHKYKYGER